MAQEQMAFSWGDQPAPTGRLPEIEPLAGRLRKLAGRGVYLGTSSWKYPGWLGKVYNPARYETRGKVSNKKFNDECLREYATIFPTVCGDFAFYRFPSDATWQRTFDQLPDHYRFSLKIPEDVTVETFPNLPRYGQRAGMSNAHFMDAELVRKQLLRRLEPYRDKLGVLIFQFGTIHTGPMSQPKQFARSLHKMLNRLPTDEYRFAVEVRNPDFLEPDTHYLDMLRQHNVAHCLNSWTRMPALPEQMRVEGINTAKHTVARLLLRPGRAYQEAVDQFSPYERVQDPYPAGRSALQDLIEQQLKDYGTGQNALYAFVNNRFEGNAIETIESVVNEIQ
jgi:uncharacterized protein YecE (DUF72 family)